LANTQLELTHLKKELADQMEKNTENINKFKKINQKFTECEKNYDKELGIIKACVEMKNSEVKAAQSRIGEQDREVNELLSYQNHFRLITYIAAEKYATNQSRIGWRHE